MGQALDAVAHHQAHRAGVMIGPDAFGPERALVFEKILGDDVERVVPGDRRELTGAFRPGAAQRLRQAVLVMDAFGIARDFGADDARRIALVGRAMDAPDARSVDHFDVERAGGRAIMRADGRAAEDSRGRVHQVLCLKTS